MRFSVLTHLSERTHKEVLKCLHKTLSTDGILVVTVRPRAYLPSIGLLETDYRNGYLFAPHNVQSVDGDVPYGHTVTADSYIRDHWTSMFHILDRWWLLEDNMQVAYVLKKISHA